MERRGQQRHALTGRRDFLAVSFESIPLLANLDSFGLQITVDHGHFLPGLSIGFDQFPRGFSVFASLLLELFDLLLLPLSELFLLVAARQGHREQHQYWDQDTHRRFSVD